MLSRGQLSLIREQLKSKGKLVGEAKSLMTSCQCNPSCVVAGHIERDQGETYPIKDFLD